MAARKAKSATGIIERVAKDGTRSYLAHVRVLPFTPVARTFRTAKEAREWREAETRKLREQRGKRGAVRADITALTIAGLADEYLKEPSTRALRSFDSLEPLLQWWIDRFAATKVREVGAPLLREARTALSKGGKHGRSAGTVNRYMSAMRACWNWGRSAGLVAASDVWPEKLMLPEPRGRTRALSDDELQGLLAACKDDALMHAAIVVSLATGVRQSELLRLEWTDVDLGRSTLRVRLSKNNESRAVHLPAKAVDVLTALKESAGEQARYVFPHPGASKADEQRALDKHGLEYRWRLVRAKAKLADFRWHDLRHSCASFLAQNGATLLEIGSVLGHRSPSITQRYAHLVEAQPVTGHAALDAKLGRAMDAKLAQESAP